MDYNNDVRKCKQCGGVINNFPDFIIVKGFNTICKKCFPTPKGEPYRANVKRLKKSEEPSLTRGLVSSIYNLGSE